MLEREIFRCKLITGKILTLVLEVSSILKISLITVFNLDSCLLFWQDGVTLQLF